MQICHNVAAMGEIQLANLIIRGSACLRSLSEISVTFTGYLINKKFRTYVI